MQKPDFRTIDLNLLLVLQDLLETRSTVLTAERLHMSQPAVSRALSRLRKVFGDKLLIKSVPTMVATEYALALSERLSKLLQEMEDFFEVPAFSPADAERTFRIATTDYGALAILPRLLKAVSKEAPRVSLAIHTLNRDVFGGLASGALDVVLIGDLDIPPNLHVRNIFSDHYLAAVPPGHPAASHIRDDTMDLDTYLAYPHVRISLVGDRDRTDRHFMEIGRKRWISVQLPYFGIADIIAVSADAILTMPSRAMLPLAKRERLATFVPPVDILRTPYHMVWHERTDSDIAARWLRQKILDVAEASDEGH